MSLADVITLVIGGDPDAPAFSQLVRGPDYKVTGLFGDAEGTSMSRSLGLRVGAHESLHCPLNALLRRFPAAPDDLSAADRALLERALPALRELTGERIELAAYERDDLFIEVWPTAFRRIQQLVALADQPLGPGEPRLGRPHMPMPRWIWVRGVPFDLVRPAIEAVVAKQFEETTPADLPELNDFAAGRSTVLVRAGELLADFTEVVNLEVWMFDQAGLPIDPNYVFGTFTLIADDVLFPYLRDLRRPDEATVKKWDGPERHVIVLSDHEGLPYQPWDDHPPDPVPPRTLGVGAASHDPNAEGVVVIDDPGLVGGLTSLVVPGEHVRTALHPFGRLEDVTRVGLRRWSFVRLRVVDYGRWFPRRPEEEAPLTPPAAGGGLPLLPRYTEGNELIPIADGAAALREVYRAVRATYVAETYDTLDARPEGTPRPPDSVAGTQVLLSNWKITPDLPLLGLRGTLSVPATQPAEAIPVDPAELIARLRMIPALPYRLPGATGGGQPLARQDYYWVAERDTLPPGAWVEVRQLGVGDDFRTDDPRIPGEDAGAVTYGIVTPALDSATAVSSFVGPGGAFALGVVFDRDFSLSPGDPELAATLRILYWEADEDDPDPLTTATSGKGRERTRAFGEVTLPFPVGALTPPSPAIGGVTVTSGASLLWEGVPGEALLVLAPATLTAAKTVVVLNSRTGAMTAVAAAPNPASDILITLTDFARRDRALVGFVDAAPADADPSFCTHLLWLAVTETQELSGVAPVHPTEVAGLAREAIAAGVDVRLLAWDNALDSNPLANSLGMVKAINLLLAGRRGQALLDGFHRPAASHHQKPAFVRTPDGVVAFVGGVDLASGRYDVPGHREPNPTRPGGLWHDIHCRIRGKAAWDVYRNFQQRWNATTARVIDPEVPFTPLPDPHPDHEVDNPALTLAAGSSAVQINRTIPRFVEEYADFVNPDLGDLSALRAYERVFDQARRFLYIEEQYFFNVAFAERLNERLRGDDALEFLFLILPAVLSEFAPIDLALYAVRRKALTTLVYGQPSIEGVADTTSLPNYVGDKVVIFNPISDDGAPVYVHSKSIIADDMWMSVGSSNLNRRSMTYDSEINAAAIDGELSRGAHRTPRIFRTSLIAEHLRLEPDQAPLVDDPRDAFHLVREVLAGDRPDLEPVGMIPHDFDRTHYDLDPDMAPPTFQEALDLVLDPDGTEPGHAISLIGLQTLLQSLAAGTDAAPFGGVGRVEVTLDTSAVPPPVGAELRLRLRLSALPAAGGVEVLAELEPFDPAQPADLGIVAIGNDYRLEGFAFSTAAPEVVVATAGPVDFLPAAFVTSQTLVFG